MFVRTKQLAYPNDGVIIIGDFNAHPWEDNLRMSEYINSCIHQKEFEYYLNTNRRERLFFNPYFEYIQNDCDNNLIGTFYNEKYIGIIDFALLSKDITNYAPKVLTNICGDEILEKNKNNMHIVKYELDHLPIQLKLN
jgi:hypothetical protein